MKVSPEPLVIHFCGVGKMGLPMAMQLARAGCVLTVSDPCARRREQAQARGLKVAGDDAEDIAQAQVVVSSLPAMLRAPWACRWPGRLVLGRCMWIQAPSHHSFQPKSWPYYWRLVWAICGRLFGQQHDGRVRAVDHAGFGFAYGLRTNLAFAAGIGFVPFLSGQGRGGSVDEARSQFDDRTDQCHAG